MLPLSLTLPTVARTLFLASSPQQISDRLLGDTWDCVAVFAPDADTEGNFKADLFERFNADYREFTQLMDRFLPDPRALPYADRLARLTELRAYVRSHFLREDAAINWTEIGAKVKRLVDERISARVRDLMSPVSILDQDFDQKIAGLPHDEARASVMEHSIRAQIHEKLADNPVYFERLSVQLERIIQDLRNRLIDSAEACLRMETLLRQTRSEADVAAEHGLADVAAEHGLSPLSFAILELLSGGSGEVGSADRVRESQPIYYANLDDEAKNLAIKVESVVAYHSSVVDWQSNEETKREMRRDIKRELRPAGEYTEPQLDELASRIVELAGRRSGQ